MADRQFAFGTFVLDGAAGILRDRGVQIDIGSRGLALLEALLEASGQPVAKSVLMDAAWPKTAVEESNLTVQVAALRKCLGQTPDGGEWIVTVPRVGYRFARRRTAAPETASASDLPPDTKTSIAVLPFDNMSSDPEQEYFAVGLSEDLITDLSKVPGFTVIARNSSFAYKGKQVDVRTVAAELGVRYVIEGSVRRAAGTVRINAQIVDATDHSHVWADRFDRDLADIFGLQDEIVGKIIHAIVGTIPSIHLVASQRAKSLDAYDLFVRGRVLVSQWSESNRAGRELLQGSIAIEPDFAEAHAWLAYSHHFAWLLRGESPNLHRPLARQASQRAVALDRGNAASHWSRGLVLAYDALLYEGVAECETALAINPNHADAWIALADLRVLEGRAGEGVECARNAFRLNPYPPPAYRWYFGFALYAAGRYEDVVETLQHEEMQGKGSQRILAASLAQLGRLDEAEAEARRFLAAYPTFTVAGWDSIHPFRRADDRRHFVDGYLKAGLPG
ncbi:winged helix-turn-helix domain-containing protein [Mesorhizobium sp. LHD-90]|uniref:winged helix-turn-helix domain-containing tetratricopeptide repeat protein n=1 Tax=Mesorhizobium sp. LHD-90 TaxID=3071414 RepID=UPI0027E15FC6|nr:winged helix-turn-helix domain-containing protein [Mesorhizobium sp. LHD-90]MDQ6434583.1 winged helix-turn-helix domain-containing protein [Mesorhizobium sp. LHD-90]